MYIYPDNLSAKATLWLWELRDIGIIGVGLLLSVLALTQTGIALPLVLTAVFAFLTIRHEGTSILDFIRYAAAFLLTTILRMEARLMSRKQKKKDAREQSTRQLMGIDDITDYGIATRMGELVFFAIKPTNISVLPDAGVGARIYALLNVVKGMAEIEMLALNSKESFENNKAFYRQRANEEELPVIRKLLEQDSKHLDRIQVLMASSREFYILVRLQGKKESDVFSYLSRIEKSIKDNGFTVRRATEEDIKRMLGVYFEQNVTTERYEDHDGERWVLFGE